MVDWKRLLPSKQRLWTAFAASMVCVLFIVERQSGLHNSSQEPTGLYAPAIEKFGELQETGSQDQGAKYDDIFPIDTIPDQFVRKRTASTTKISMHPSKFTKRPQANLKKASPSPAYPTSR
jgi:hypothetical protein